MNVTHGNPVAKPARQMTEYYFDNDNSITIHTEEFGARVQAERDELDDTVKLTIEEQWFQSADLEDLINFLEQVKRSMNAGGNKIELPVDAPFGA